MEPASWYELAAAAACLLLVALTAATEAVLAEISRQGLRDLADKTRRALGSVEALLARPRDYTMVMVLLRTLGAVAFALLLAAVAARERLPGGLPGTFLIAAPLLLVLGYSVPVALARRSRQSTAANLLVFAVVATALARPFLLVYDVATGLGRWVLRQPQPAHAAATPAEQALAPVLGPGLAPDPDAATNLNADDEAEMIEAVRDLDDDTARKIMTTRLDLVALPDDAPLAEAIAVVQETGYSRLPVYHHAIDQIVGLLYAKDLLRFVARGVPATTVATLMRPLRLIVPESKPIDALLADMRRTKQHLALVADEYGGTAGIVTIEDILEEIVGAIDDEHDETTAPDIVPLSDHEFVVAGRLSTDDVSDKLDLHWAEGEEHLTLAGLVQRELGHLPVADESLDYDGARITVLEVDGHRLERLRIEKLNGRALPSLPNGNGGYADGLARAAGEGK